MAWNYRGYGKSEGLPIPPHIKSDVEHVYKFIVEELNITEKIGTYGRSLGGMPASHLAATYPDKIELLIVDRSFASLDLACKKRFPGPGAEYLYKFFSLS